LNEKILFWLDIGLTQFAIAKFLQEKLSSEFYAIIDCNEHLRKFFSSQQLVKFHKIWFYRDFFKEIKNEIDLEYLQNFEKKYDINLWQLAYNERYFYNFNKYYKFNTNEILSILEQDCKLFERILDEIKPNFLIIRMTDYHQNHLLHEICKKRRIKILTLSPARFGTRSILSSDADQLDVVNDDVDSSNTFESFEELQQKMDSYWEQTIMFTSKDRSSNLLRFKSAFRFLVYVCNKNYQSYYANFGRTRFNVLRKEFSLLIRKKIRESFLKKNCLKQINPSIKYIYFPLHVEPERTVSISAPYYTNQLELIVNIAKSIPIDYVLLVKEHPGMVTEGWRQISFYKKILSLPNVTLVHPTAPHHQLIKNSSLIMTITGTASFEATLYQKPSIVFADVIFSSLNSVHRVTNIEELPSLIRTVLKHQVNLKDISNYLSKIEKYSFDFDMAKIALEWYDDFFYGGFLKEVEISEKEMEIFLEDHRKEFELLTSQFIKKIIT